MFKKFLGHSPMTKNATLIAHFICNYLRICKSQDRSQPLFQKVISVHQGRPGGNVIGSSGHFHQAPLDFISTRHVVLLLSARVHSTDLRRSARRTRLLLP